jgi:hypothetical protein
MLLGKKPEVTMVQLIPCSNCRRHVRTTEAACPFCRTATRRYSSFGLLGIAALGIGVAVLVSNGSACGSSTGGGGGADAGSDADLDTGGGGSLYGPPPPP